MRKYADFFGDLAFDENSEIEEPTESEPIQLNFCLTENSKCNISKNSKSYRFPIDYVIEKYSFRLTTQDRYYGEVFFPISFIKRILEKNGEKVFFNNWIKEQINDIDVHCEKGKFKLKEISEFLLNEKPNVPEVHVVVNRDKMLLFTPNAEGNKFLKIEHTDFRKIVIDHVEPMKNILDESKKDLPFLSKITLHHKNNVGHSATPKQYKSSTTSLFNSFETTNSDIILLKNELTFLKGKIKLQLMDASEN